MLAGFVRWVDRLTAWSGRWLSWLPLLMALTTLAVVILRYGLNTGSIALQEAVMYAHGAVLLLGISYTLQQDAHVRVDLVYNRMAPAMRGRINWLGHLVFLVPLCLVILVTSWPYVLSSWRVREGSAEVGGLPGIFLLKTLLPVTAGWLLLQALAELARPFVADKSGDGA